MSTQHFIVKCRTCGTIITQCRCPGPKLEVFSVCETCTARLREDSDRLNKLEFHAVDRSGNTSELVMQFDRSLALRDAIDDL